MRSTRNGVHILGKAAPAVGSGGVLGGVLRCTGGVPVGYTPVPLFSELRAHFVRPASRTCSTGELSGAATSQEVLLARAVAVETAEEAAVDARRSFLKRASEGTRRPSLASPLVSEVAL